MVVSSALSKHPSSGSSGFQRILQTSPFIHFPLRTKRRQPRADECSSALQLARATSDLLYVIIPFFLFFFFFVLRSERHHPRTRFFPRQRSIVEHERSLTPVFADEDKTWCTCALSCRLLQREAIENSLLFVREHRRSLCLVEETFQQMTFS